MVIGNPPRMAEVPLKLYWKQWHKMEESGDPVTFDRAGKCTILNEISKGEGPSKQVPESSDDSSRESSDDSDQHQHQHSKPRDCKSDAMKISFLRHLLPSSESNYQWILKVIEPMEVSYYHSLDLFCVVLLMILCLGGWRSPVKVSSYVLFLEVSKPILGPTPPWGG